MLNTVHPLFHRHMQAARDGLGVMLAKPLTTLMTVVIIAISLTLPTLFWLLSHHAQGLAHDYYKKATCVLYLMPSTNATQMQDTLTQVQHLPGTHLAVLKTPADNLKALEKEEGMRDLIRFLPSNPLPAVIEVTPTLHETKLNELATFVETLKKLPYVEQVKFDMDWTQQFHGMLDVIQRFAKGMMILLVLTVVLMIGNTLRLALNLRAEEIQVLKLVGAIHAYIMRPFLYTGIWYAMFGAIICIVFINIFLYGFNEALEQWQLLYQLHLPFVRLTITEAYTLLFCSAALGWVTAQGFIRSQLARL